ncbi:Hypothetical protein ERS075534_04629 [Mycobacteroides abscessus]|uniref:hypothetical protein n=1 Tax=Mycobacteriaceae TaxID=1762 RepID=UPI0003007ECF|nr:hypothetical protein [Mycobacteroides abscessus]CPT79156.1 Hypothetical protein ERS075534_04629 [Mycobacteroides abscessus]CPU62757.1 Hypothetical protein ERS075561_04586 [Mycobacteroides abscessus]SKQ36800.1 Uncharacterised protein [Mycobacteroides abscessus subsp. massiliense]SKW96882.1 Uncharacterised protein [Mycobacteroides abscessus subsp. massiliense]
MRVAGTIGKGVAAATLIGALGIPMAASAAAVPTAQSSSAETISELQADGYNVIVNKVGDAAIGRCNVAAVRKGQIIKGTWLQRIPGRVSSSGRYSTVYVDLMCKA